MFKGGGSPLEVIYTTTMSNSYATGGDTLNLPTSDVKYGDVVGVAILNPIPVVGGDRIYSWNGSTSTPKITANVISTAAEVANTTDLSAVTLRVRVTYAR